MNATIARADFMKALSACASVVDKRSTTIPIIQGVLIEAREAFHVAATDLDLTLRMTCPATIREAGAFVINLETVTEFVRSAPDDSISLALAGLKLEIASGTAKFVIPVRDAADYPTLPEHDDAPVALVTDMETLATGYESVLYATGDGVRQAPDGTKMPKGVLLRDAAGRLEFCATDGHRLAYAYRVHDDEQDGISDVTPLRAAKAILKLRDGERVRVRVATNHIFLEHPAFDFAYRRPDVPFPRFEESIPKRPDLESVVDRKRLLETIRRVLLLAPNDNGVTLVASSGRLTVTPLREERGRGSDYLPYDGGDGFEVSVSGRYLSQSLDAIDTGSVSLSLAANGAMLVVRSASADLDAMESVHCVMYRYLG